MATSKYPTTQYTSEQFVESCGAVLFDMSQEPHRVCLINYTYGESDEWYLPKGRRNQGESRRQAALREVEEETGYSCHVHPVAMKTRAPRASDPEDIPDELRLRTDSDEPFMVTHRELTPRSDVKIIWWYIAAVDGAAPSHGSFRADFFDYEDAIRKLTFQKDRDVLERAINLVETSKRNETQTLDPI
ncbi:NUDIX hydrolase domain-like protein [Aspergillus karnatakaensis]|uniref:putative NUDIX domain n=1 Tax=Aspergillus karnatakaensis TaxID=1810916 RepID=UPI003CCD6BA4